jgi:hypothetical protein
MSRLRQLEARRQALLRRAAEQRDELAARLAQLTPGAMLRGSGDRSAIRELRHPLAWAAALAGLLFLGRTREVLTFVLWIRSALALAGRAAHLVRLLTRLRAPRAGH